VNSWGHSLYGRLVLALLIALGASFGTMYVLFQSHMEVSGESNAARIISVQIRMVEALLQTRSTAELPALGGLRVAASPSGAAPSSPRQLERAMRIRRDLSEELGRPVAVEAVARPIPGLWVDLRPRGKPMQWLYLPSPKVHRYREDSLAFSMVVGFLVFFVGGVLLLWQIQRPLKRLSHALESVGHNPSFEKLPVGGGGITRILSLRYNEMVDRLNQLESDRSVMLAGIAHDLRTPIARMRLITELAQTDRRAEFTHNLDNIERIVDQFLTYARGSEGEKSEVCDLGSFVEEVASIYAGRGVDTRHSGEECPATIRPNALRRALINLIENAIEYARPPITVECSQKDGETAIYIRDSGDGIPEADLASAIRPFSRLDPSRGGQGHCGLGLVIAKKIIDEHSGVLSLSNLDGGGLQAQIRLPSGG
jgi:two-component system, OmpR family, osmolarity sensor histidine kinase EnvZ